MPDKLEQLLGKDGVKMLETLSPEMRQQKVIRHLTIQLGTVVQLLVQKGLVTIEEYDAAEAIVAKAFDDRVAQTIADPEKK